MKWIGNRISFLEGKDKTTIVIYPENKFIIKALMGAWFAMWITVGATMFWSLSLNLTEQELIIVVVFLCFWFYYALRVGRSFFWLMWGKEMLKIDEIAVSYKKAIHTYGKAVPYYLENIQKMRQEIPKENSIQAVWENSPWVRGGERLEFDYMGKTIRFGRKLSEKESKLLFDLIRKKLEEMIKLKRKKSNL